MSSHLVLCIVPPLYAVKMICQSGAKLLSFGRPSLPHHSSLPTLRISSLTLVLFSVVAAESARATKALGEGETGDGIVSQRVETGERRLAFPGLL